MDEAIQRGENRPHYPVPKSLTTAVSIVQRLKLMESGNRLLDKDFVVLDQVVGFSEVGIRSAWHDSLIWMIGYVIVGTIVYFVQNNYLVETKTQVLVWQLDGSPLYWTAKAASFSGLLFSTGMCVYISKYYIGNACKKAINSVLLTRAIFLVGFSLVIFVFLNAVNKMILTDKAIAGTAYSLSFVSKGFSKNVYYFLHNYFRRALFEAAIVSLLSNFISVAIPFLSIFIFRASRKKEKTLGLERE